MSDFVFLQNPITGTWMISAPKRAKRPDVAKGVEPVCPFCPGREKDEREVYRISSKGREGSESREEKSTLSTSSTSSTFDSDWLIRVVPNKFPFSPHHFVIIHSPDHHKNIDELSKSQVELIFQTYRRFFNDYKDKGEVYIFHNRGEKAGESLPHPHTQVAVIPFEVKTGLPRLDPWANSDTAPKPNMIGADNHEQLAKIETIENGDFYMFCPITSQWPDEVWIAPKERGRSFGEITDTQITQFSDMVVRLLRIFDLRHGHEFPFNYYIYPGGDWYFRLIPRMKSLGGFEIGTGIFINTQDPRETIQFIKNHFENSDEEKIKEDQAEYRKGV